MAESISISHPEFSEGRLTLRGGSIFSSPRLVIDGQEEPRGSRTVRVLNDSGKTVEIDCRYSVFDPIPTIKVNGRPIDLAPPLGAFVKLWIALPIGLAFMGGAIGGLFGALATLTNARIFRLSGNTSSKFLSSAGVSITAAILWWEVSSRLSEVTRRYFAAAA